MVRNGESIVEYYNGIANKYEPVCKFVQSQTSMIYKVVHSYRPNQSANKERLLDVGCGTGLASEPFFNPNLDIYGIDGAPQMLEIFSKKGFTFSAKIDLNYQPFPFSDNFFNYVISNGLFMLFPRLDDIFFEASRVIKSGGLFCFTVENVDRTFPPITFRTGMKIYRHSLDYINKLLNDGGFKFISYNNYVDYYRYYFGENVIFSAILCEKN